MVLRSLQARMQLRQHSADVVGSIPIDLFGVYCRLSKGTFATQADRGSAPLPQAVGERLFASEMVLHLVQAMVEELQTVAQMEALDLGAAEERSVAGGIAEEILPDLPRASRPSEFSELLDLIRRELRRISDHVCAVDIGDAPQYEGVFLQKDNLSHICRMVLADKVHVVGREP